MNLFPALESDDIRFVGDTHFHSRHEPGEVDRRERFLAFLEGVPAPSTLFLIGDIFDFYFEYRSVVSNRYLDLLEGLRACSERGVDTRFIGGNHDFWVGNFFRRELGIRVHEGEIRFEAQGRRVSCSHGDLVMPHDRGYKLLKSIIRNRGVIAVSRWIHPDILDAIATLVSRGSRGMQHQSQEERARMLVDWAHRHFFLRGNDIYVMGHVHRAVHDVRDGREFVIVGDWFEGAGSYARLHGGQLTLEDAAKDQG